LHHSQCLGTFVRVFLCLPVLCVCVSVCTSMFVCQLPCYPGRISESDVDQIEASENFFCQEPGHVVQEWHWQYARMA